MISHQSQRVAEKAQQIYEDRLQRELEAKYLNQFVAIEPDSSDYFVADSFSKAVAAARQAFPDRIAFVIRIGHGAALHMGGYSS